MTMGTKIVFIITLIVSIIVPFGYYLLGEKSRKRYKRAIGTNAFFFFGAFAIASIMLLGGPNVQAAEAVTADAGFATGMGYLAAAIVTGLSCIGGGIAVAKHKHEWLCGGGTHFHKGHYHQHHACVGEDKSAHTEK